MGVQKIAVKRVLELLVRAIIGVQHIYHGIGVCRGVGQVGIFTCGLCTSIHSFAKHSVIVRVC